MSIQPEDFLSQSPSAFLEQPGFLETAQLAPPQPKVEQDPNFMKVAVGIAAALVVLRVLMKSSLSGEQPRTADEINEAASRIYKRILPAWMQAAAPAIAQAYRLGATDTVSYAELESMASAYAAELGQYVHDSSILALTEGFNAQINAGWSERLAWARVSEGYGLDSSQMRSYVKGLMSKDKSEYLSDPIPATARAAVDRAFLTRADRVGTNEAFKASQVGRNVVWLSMQASGQLPDGTMKRWVTADDERVCPVCGPLHMVTIPLHRRFESNGQYFYAPGVHPNCRCEIELVYPELGIDVVKALGGDPFDRDAEGKFAARESRKAKPLAEKKTLSGLRQKKTLSSLGRKKLSETKSLTEVKADAALSSLAQGKSLSSLSEAKTADETKLASLVARAASTQRLSELAALSEAKAAADAEAAAKAAADAKAKKKAKRKTLKPSDPQVWDTTVWVPADLFMRARGQKSTSIEIGAPVDFSSNTTTDKQWALAVRENTGGLGTGLGDGFDKAFDDYMRQEGGAIVSSNRAAMEQQEKLGDEVSDPKEMLKGEEGEAREWATLLSSRDKASLLKWWGTLAANPEAYMYLGDPPTPEEMTATEIAQVILVAAKTEALDNYSAGNNRIIGQFLDDKVEWNNDQINAAMREGELIHDRHQMIADDSSVVDRVSPVFFRIKGGWYGTRSSNTDGTTHTAMARGKYRVKNVSKAPIPEPMRDSFGDDAALKTFKELVIVDLVLDEGVK